MQSGIVFAPMALASGNMAPLDPHGFISRRRALLGAAAVIAGATSLTAFAVEPDWGKTSISPPSSFWTQPRWVWLKHAKTGEEIRVVYWADGQLIQSAYEQASWFLRDRRFEKMLKVNDPVITNAVSAGKVSKPQLTPWALMDPIVLDILYAHNAWLQVYGMPRALMVTSGFRHFITNAMTEGAARASWHLRAGAADFFIPGVPAEQVARFGRYLAGGGVGLYPSNNFIHVDRGRVRSWTT